MNITCPLISLVSINVGYQFRAGISPCPGGKALVVQLRDLSEGLQILWDRLEPVNEEGIKQDYFIRRGDILLSARGKKNQIIYVDTDATNIIAPNYLLILRPTSQLILPQYLAWYLRHPGRPQIEGTRRGSTVQMISRGDLGAIVISVPTIETQNQVIKIEALLEEEGRLMSQLKEARLSYVNSMLLKVVGGVNT